MWAGAPPKASASSCGLSWRSSPTARILPLHQQYPHLQALEEIERDGVPGLIEVLCEEGTETARYVVWAAIGWPPRLQPAWRNRVTEERKRIVREMAVRTETILCTVLHEAHRRQVEETMETLVEGSEGFY